MYIAGTFSSGVAPRGFVARFLADGTLDASFEVGGVFTQTASGAESALSALALQPDGKLLAGGLVYQNPTGNDFALLRFH
jgi:hypothetical protein